MSLSGWTPAKATALLLERELFGMRFELDRIRALLAELGNPQDSFRSVHVVGTNGKTSTTRFTAAALAGAGQSVGAYVSPHLTGFHERILLSGSEGISEVEAGTFAEALGRVAEAAGVVEAGVLDGELVTQFELVTAAAFLIFAEAGVGVAVIEAGLGGRWDATNVLASPKVVVLTSVGLDHTQWLGDDVESIAAEKLAVVQRGDVLITPVALDPQLQQQALARAEEVGAQWKSVDGRVAEGAVLAALGEFQRENFGLAIAAAVELSGDLTDEQINVAAKTLVPGRMMITNDKPLTILDAAHNPQGAQRLAESLIGLADSRKLIGVVGMLADKDVPGFLSPLLPMFDGLVATAPLNPRSLSADALADHAIALGMSKDKISVVADARAAVSAAGLASGEDGLVLVTGSIHLIGDLVSEPGERIVSAL